MSLQMCQKQLQECQKQLEEMTSRVEQLEREKMDYLEKEKDWFASIPCSIIQPQTKFQ
jgi:hypothetical protein